MTQISHFDSTAAGGPPPMARLGLQFDAERLQEELECLRGTSWLPERPFVASGFSEPITPKWRALPLRSQGGDPTRTDPGGPGTAEFADTEFLRQAPYLAEVLASLPCELRSARLLSLAEGGSVAEHVDAHHGFKYGQVRLHVPITTNPEALLFIEGQAYHWEVGQLWYGDFGRPHALRNDGATERVHLVIDCLVSPQLLQLFPADFRATMDEGEILHNRRPYAGDVARLRNHQCQFDVPAAILRSGADKAAAMTENRPATVQLHEDRLMLTIGDSVRFALTHLGADEFRFAGWTEERTVRFSHEAHGVDAVIFRIRHGNRARDLRCPARPLPR
ncbi:aspartyl/asparaginyl beta-hydroxylase domain-containing protein [Nonomuraea sp. NPDC003201]